MTDRLARLRELAEAAQMPWLAAGLDGWCGVGGLYINDDDVTRFMKACDPDTILAMTAVVEAARVYCSVALTERFPNPQQRDDQMRTFSELEAALANLDHLPQGEEIR